MKFMCDLPEDYKVIMYDLPEVCKGIMHEVYVIYVKLIKRSCLI